MSHSSSPRRGASDDSVTARTSRLVIWPSCSKQIVGESGASGDDARAWRGLDFDRHGVERIDGAEIERAAAVVARMRSRGPPSASSTVSREAPKPVSARSVRQRRRRRRRRRSAPGCARRAADAGARDRGRGRAARAARVSGSAQPSRAAARLKADGAGTHEHLARSIAARAAWRRRRSGTDRRRRARRRGGRDGEHLVDGAVERARPGPRCAADERRRQAEMALAAEHDFGRADQPRAPRRSGRRRRPRRCRRWTASAAMRQSRARSHQEATCHASSFSAAPTEARAAGGSGWQAAPISTSTLSLAGRTAAPARQPVPVRIGGFGGAAGLADYLARRAHRRADRRHASLCRAISANARRGCARSRRALRGAAPSAVDCGRRRPLDRGRGRRATPCARSGQTPRRVFVALGRQEIAPFAASAAAPLSDPQRRSGRSAVAVAARGLCDRPRAVRVRPTNARCMPAHGIDIVVAKNSGGGATYGKIARSARARHRGRDAAPAASAGGARRRDRRRGRSVARSCAHLGCGARRVNQRRAPGRAITRVSREPTMTSVAISALAASAAASVITHHALVRAPDRAAEDDRCRGRQVPAQKARWRRRTATAAPAKPDCKAR